MTSLAWPGTSITRSEPTETLGGRRAYGELVGAAHELGDRAIGRGTARRWRASSSPKSVSLDDDDRVAAAAAVIEDDDVSRVGETDVEHVDNVVSGLAEDGGDAR